MKDDKSKTEFNLEIVYRERIGDLLFFIGTILALISTYQDEQSITQPQEQQLTNDETSTSINNPLRTLALANWIFLAAVLIFSNTSYTRFRELQASTPENAPLPNKKSLFGSELVAIGNLVKVIGFSLTAIGNQIQADNPLVKTDLNNI